MEVMSGVKYDDLLGGEEVKVLQKNVRIGSNITIKRGELLARGNDGYFSPATGSDMNKLMAVAKEEVGSTDNRVTTVYYTGLFNRSKIICGSDIDLSEYEIALKSQGIYMTDIEDLAEWTPINYGSDTGSDIGLEVGSDVGSEIEGSDS